jgi:transposase
VKTLLRKLQPDPYARRAAMIISYISRGWPIPTVCRVLRVSRPKVWRVLRRLHEGGPENALIRRKSPGRPSRRAEVVQYLWRGYTFEQAVERFGLHITSIRRIARSAGITRHAARPADTAELFQ